MAICSSVKPTKYIHTYIYKGSDRAIGAVKEQTYINTISIITAASCKTVRIYDLHNHLDNPPVTHLGLHKWSENIYVSYDTASDKDAIEWFPVSNAVSTTTTLSWKTVRYTRFPQLYQGSVSTFHKVGEKTWASQETARPERPWQSPKNWVEVSLASKPELLDDHDVRLSNGLFESAIANCTNPAPRTKLARTESDDFFYEETFKRSRRTMLERCKRKY